MKKSGFLMTCVSFLILSTPNVFAYTGFGICNFGKEEVPVIVCYGPTVLKETQVTGDVKIAGTLKASEVNAGTMTVTGDTNLKNSTIIGDAKITGRLNADQVNFKNNVHIVGAKSLLNQSSVKGSVTIHVDHSTPYFKLQCGSVVEGSISFEGEKGIVQITDDSLVRGKITNGTVEFIRVKCK